MDKQEERITDKFLTELADEEANLVNADNALRDAITNFKIASQKYSAIRDMVTTHLGNSPYDGSVLWPANLELPDELDRGKFRFMHMKTGPAVDEVLAEANNPMNKHEINHNLFKGGHAKGRGLSTSDVNSMDSRAVNAAVMTLVRTDKVEKVDGEKYKIKRN